MVDENRGSTSEWKKWLRLSCGWLLFAAVVVSIGVAIFFGTRLYISVSNDVARLDLQVGRLQDQFDRALDNNDRALDLYDQVIEDVETNRRDINEQLSRVIQRNDEVLAL